MAPRTRFKPFVPDLIAAIFPPMFYSINALRMGALEETSEATPYFGLIYFLGPLIAEAIVGIALVFGRRTGIIINLIFWLLLAGYAIFVQLPITFGYILFHCSWIYAWLRLTGLIKPSTISEPTSQV